MAEHQIRFEDGAAYERMMGVWTQLVGETFLDWLALPSGLRWLDVGCGNGAFTELVCSRAAPAKIDGIDPSDAQLDYARARPGAAKARFHKGDARALPFGDNSFEAAVMALAIFFVPEPEKGVAEMARVVAPGGTMAAYAWDFPGGGYPLQAMQDAMRAGGLKPPLPPRAEVARSETLRELWLGAGLEAVETRPIRVMRTFADFEEFWAIGTAGASMVSVMSELSEAERALLKQRVRTLYPPDAAGRVTCTGHVNAVKGRVPG